MNVMNFKTFVDMQIRHVLNIRINFIVFGSLAIEGIVWGVLSKNTFYACKAKRYIGGTI